MGRKVFGRGTARERDGDTGLRCFGNRPQFKVTLLTVFTTIHFLKIIKRKKIDTDSY
jgi:hypothetical protein